MPICCVVQLLCNCCDYSSVVEHLSAGLSYIFILDIVVVSWFSTVTATLRMLLQILLQNYVTCNKMLHALNLAD